MMFYMFYAAYVLLFIRFVLFVIGVLITPAAQLDAKATESIFTSIIYGLFAGVAVGHYVGIWP